MSSVMKPVGPEEPQVYWKRRALVVGIILLVLLLLWLVFRPKSDGEPEVGAAAVSPSPSVLSPLPTASSSPSSSSSASPSASSGLCKDGDIDVTVTTDQTTYKPDADPVITMVIVNTGATACDRNVGSNANEIMISSGGTQVWSSDDCSTASGDEIQTLGPDEKATVRVTWPRTSSQGSCGGTQPAVDPGSYEAVGRNDKIESDQATFVLQ